MAFRGKIKNKIKIILSGFLNEQWQYIKPLDTIKKNAHAPIVSDRFSLFDFIIKNELDKAPIVFFEFGVFEGETFNYWRTNHTDPQSEFYGFDTFTGLPEDWNTRKKGSYSADGKLPEINDTRAKFVKGLFQKTLPDFLKNKKFETKKNVLHLDADLYSSTLYVLTSFLPVFKKDDILIFDEFGIELNHEFRAFIDFVDMSKIKYEAICVTKNFTQAAIKIL